MAYGVKRGVRAAGEYNLMDLGGLALAGAAGIVAALVTDYRQKGESSALYTINRWVADLGDLVGYGQVPLWTVVVGLIVLGAGSIFYFQPITRQGAFAQGAGLLAVIMTATPSDLAGALAPAAGGTFDELDSISYTEISGEPEDFAKIAARTAPAVFSQGEMRTLQVQETRAARYEIRLEIVFPDGVPDDIDAKIRRGLLRGRLHNPDTGSTYNLFRNAGGDMIMRGDSLIIAAAVPARSSETTLWVRIECDGYAIEEQSAAATVSRGLEWTVNMRESSTPLFMQRLGKSYWF
jgi:hypothetical protein